MISDAVVCENGAAGRARHRGGAQAATIRFVPERFDKIYFNWMENIRDWCISRQLWWGHRIPAFYCDDCGEMIVAREDADRLPQVRRAHCRQDEDVLDTWFSSALWPFSTLGWPEKTAGVGLFLSHQHAGDRL